MHTKEKAATKHLGQHNSPELRKKKVKTNSFLKSRKEKRQEYIYKHLLTNKKMSTKNICNMKKIRIQLKAT